MAKRNLIKFELIEPGKEYKSIHASNYHDTYFRLRGDARALAQLEGKLDNTLLLAITEAHLPNPIIYPIEMDWVPTDSLIVRHNSFDYKISHKDDGEHIDD